MNAYTSERCAYCDAPIRHIQDGLGGFWEGDPRYTNKWTCTARRGQIIARHEPAAGVIYL
jgi:hypothetical protein